MIKITLLTYDFTTKVTYHAHRPRQLVYTRSCHGLGARNVASAAKSHSKDVIFVILFVRISFAIATKNASYQPKTPSLFPPAATADLHTRIDSRIQVLDI